MKVLSLFDGMSCGQIALQRLGIDVEKYVASEIDKYAISVAKKNFPNMIHVGDVRDVKVAEHFDLIMFGSPCQGFCHLPGTTWTLTTLEVSYSLKLSGY